jgi:hypothetical protein
MLDPFRHPKGSSLQNRKVLLQEKALQVLEVQSADGGSLACS